jgi:hypothetical protein
LIFFFLISERKKEMKGIFVFAILFALCVLSQAKLGDYSHFIGGASSFRRAGWHPINEFAVWDSSNSRWMDFPSANFAGTLRDFAVTSDNTVLAVGDFTAVNGQTAYGVAYFDGNQWCGFPHLNLFSFDKPTTPLTDYPLGYTGVAAGKAYAVEAIGNDFYVFGGSSTTTYTVNPPFGASRTVRRTNFNQVGTVRADVAGLVKFTYSNGNFTVSTLPYAAQGGSATANTAESVGGGNETNRFPGNSAPIVTSAAKLRIVSVGGTLHFYVLNGQNLFRWRVGDGTWMQMTTNGTNPTIYINNALSTYTVLAVGWRNHLGL